MPSHGTPGMLPALSDGHSESLSLVRHVLLRAGPAQGRSPAGPAPAQAQLAIIAAAVPATQGPIPCRRDPPGGPNRLRVGLSAVTVTLCQIVQCLSVCPGEPEPPPSHCCLPLRSNSLGFPRPAGPRPETRPAGHDDKPKGVIQRLSGGSESAALASPVKFSVRPSNSVIETPSR